MKKIQKLLVLIAFADPSQVLINKETRDHVMNTIVNDGAMSKEMMGALMNNKTGMMVMQ